MPVLVSWLFSDCMSAFVTLTALQTAGMFHSGVHDYRAFMYGAGSTPDSRQPLHWQSIVSSHELLSCGNRGNCDVVGEWIPAAKFVQFAH